MDDILNEFRRFAADRLEQIHHRVPGAVLTLIARTPGKPDMDIVITADADPGAVVVLRRASGQVCAGQGLGGAAAVMGTIGTMFLVPYITAGNNWTPFFVMGALLVPLSIGSVIFFSGKTSKQ